MRRLPRFRVVWALLIAAAVVSRGPVAGSQDATATAPDLKAAFLINFARFTTWPPEALPAGASLTICDRPGRIECD